MHVLNIHRRIIAQPIEKVAPLLDTLASKEDRIMPTAQWPPIRLDQGLQPGSKGGHGPIRYTVSEYLPGALVKFLFSRPRGFRGHHWFEITDLKNGQTEIKHTIDMQVVGIDILTWSFAIRWLHDALIEDGFDKIENIYLTENKKTKWTIGVRFLRWILK